MLLLKKYVFDEVDENINFVKFRAGVLEKELYKMDLINGNIEDTTLVVKQTFSISNEKLIILNIPDNYLFKKLNKTITNVIKIGNEVYYIPFSIMWKTYERAFVNLDQLSKQAVDNIRKAYYKQIDLLSKNIFPKNSKSEKYFIKEDNQLIDVTFYSWGLNFNISHDLIPYPFEIYKNYMKQFSDKSLSKLDYGDSHFSNDLSPKDYEIDYNSIEARIRYRLTGKLVSKNKSIIEYRHENGKTPIYYIDLNDNDFRVYEYGLYFNEISYRIAKGSIFNQNPNKKGCLERLERLVTLRPILSDF